MLRRSTNASILATAVLVLAAAAGGCEMAGWMAHGIAGGDGAPSDAEAEYRGLENESVAVLVDAGPTTLFQHPTAQLEVAEIISQRIAAHVPGVTVRDAEEVIDFQRNNIYWNTATFSDLAERLDVSRIVLVELVDYRLHEPGNVSIWRGTIRAGVSVAEADGPHPDDLTYSTDVAVSYPPDSAVGVVNAEQRTIRLGMLDLFGRAAAGKFYDHETEADGSS